MTAVLHIQSPEDAYNTPRQVRMLQDAAAQWLGAAHYESELAQELVLTGYEAPARVQAEAAAECIKQGLAVFEKGEAHLGTSAKRWTEFEAEAGPRREHSRRLLEKQRQQV